MIRVFNHLHTFQQSLSILHVLRTTPVVIIEQFSARFFRRIFGKSGRA